MPQPLAGTRIVYTPLPAVHFGAGTIGALPGIVRGTGGQAAAVITDAALAGTPVMAAAMAALAAGGLDAPVFTGVHPNPTTEDIAAGAEVVAALATDGIPMAVVAVGGGSVIDAAKGIALAAVNPERGRALDYRGTFAHTAMPLIAVPTTAGTGALAAFGIGPADYARISADALDDEVLDNTPRMPGAADIAAILTAAKEPDAEPQLTAA